MNNLKQLSYGTMMYIGDNRDVFPGAASRNTYGFHVEDWIYWRATLTNYPISESPIIAGFGRTSTNLFRCPTDRNDLYRILDTGPVNGDPGPYWYSYSMTSYGLTGVGNPGMTTIVSASTTYPFKLSTVKNPAFKIMLAEEQTVLDGPECSDPSGDIINDGRWEGAATSDALTARHTGKADVSFADGHVQQVTPQFGKNLTNSRPDL